MLKKYDKVYRFDYGNILNKFLSYLIQFMSNSGIVIFAFLGYIYVTQLIADNFSSDSLIYVLSLFFTVIFIALVLFFFILTFLPRKIILSDNGIKVRRYSFPPSLKRFSFNDFIPYSMILSCEIYNNKITYRRATYLRQQAFPIFAFNWKSLVKITDKYNFSFYLPVKDAENFVVEVNSRVR